MIQQIGAILVMVFAVTRAVETDFDVANYEDVSDPRLFFANITTGK